MRLFILIFGFFTAAYADTARLDTMMITLASVMGLLIVMIGVQKYRLRIKNQDLINILEHEEIGNIYRDKTAVNFDLQEIFLYFFKTLSYEAGINNNIYIVRQNMLSAVKNTPKRQSTHTIADSMRPKFLPEPNKQTSVSNDNLSEKLDPNRELVRPYRHFFGDYADIISGIHSCIEVVASSCNGKLIAIDIDQPIGPDNQILLSVEVSICEPQNIEIAEIFNDMMNPKDTVAVEKMTKFQADINKLAGAKYYIKDNSTRMSYAVVLSLPLLIADELVPFEVAPPYILHAIVVHENRDIAKTIINNLNDFNIECIYNQTDAGLISTVLDGVNFPYRAVFLDAQIFAAMNPKDQETLMAARFDNHFELVLILNNQKSAALIAADYAAELTYLPLPYTVDNIRALVSSIVRQHERLVS